MTFFNDPIRARRRAARAAHGARQCADFAALAVLQSAATIRPGIALAQGTRYARVEVGFDGG